MNETTFDTALANYTAHITGLIDTYWTRNGFKHSKPTVTTSEGPRYIRVIKAEENGSRSVHSFVDKTTGDIYKGSWKAPVKNGKRGNIYTDYIGRVNECGCEYLR